MNIDNQKILIAIVAISLLLFPTVVFTSGAFRIAFGLPFVLFFPGYTLVSALFPRRGDLSGIERVALSFGLSITIAPLIALILNYTPWGIRLYPILTSVTLSSLLLRLLPGIGRGSCLQLTASVLRSISAYPDGQG